MTKDQWIAANLEAAAHALARPEAAREIYAVLGGKIDPSKRRADLEREVARLRLTWKPRTQSFD